MYLGLDEFDNIIIASGGNYFVLNDWQELQHHTVIRNQGGRQPYDPKFRKKNVQ